MFREQVDKTPDAVAVTDGEREATWRELDASSDRLARGVMDLGVRKGDRVAALLANSIEFIVTHLALLKNGAVFVPLNPQLTPAHVEYIANHSESRLLFCDAHLAPQLQEISPNLDHVAHTIAVGESPRPKDLLSFEEVLATGSSGAPSVPLTDDDLAVFVYTSGTTGNPKGVVHTHFSCSFVVRHWRRTFRLGPGKRVLSVLPLFHVFGLHCISIPVLISGAQMVMAKTFSAQWALEAIQKYRVNLMPLVPAMASLLIHHEDFAHYDLSSLESLLVGGATCPFELLKTWRKAFPRLEIINGYGQTESCPCATGLWDVDILEKPGSIGKPWDVVEMKILNDEGRQLPSGQVGEIVYRVSSAMKEYYKEPEITEQTFRDGWIYSGDLGYVDEDGYVYIVDRKKDIIIRGGENISSIEVEDFLHSHPAVLEASAIAAPDPLLGETVMAVVVRKPGCDLSEPEVRAYCEEGLEPFKVPTRVEFVQELPRNPGGKVLKRQLKEEYFGGTDA
jgi:acyl-CoA synthetase (AMP-forming)/AMP-acid ligase II